MFDLAGVLLEFDGRASLSRLSGGRVGPSAFDALWQSPLADALYTGRSAPHEFAEAAVAVLGLAVSPETFLEEFGGWLRGPYPGAFELVAEVRRRVPVACLSNTNALEVRRFREELGLDRRFDLCAFSNEIGWRKPAPESYRVVLRALGHEDDPSRVAFFDDSASCVAGACRVGMTARQVSTVAELRSELHALGIDVRSSGPPGV